MQAQQHVTLLVLCLFDVRYSPVSHITRRFKVSNFRPEAKQASMSTLKIPT